MPNCLQNRRPFNKLTRAMKAFRLFKFSTWCFVCSNEQKIGFGKQNEPFYVKKLRNDFLTEKECQHFVINYKLTKKS